MLIQALSIGELNFDALMELYREGNAENAEYFYPQAPAEKRLALAIEGFHSYLCEQFFKMENAQYWIWEEDGMYLSALRFEKHQDGLLMEALETCPEYRKQGYAKRLILEVLKNVPENTKIYSHASKRNAASLASHRSCGFTQSLDYVVEPDGTKNDCAVTFTIYT